MKDTTSYGISYGGNNLGVEPLEPLELLGYSDSDYASDTDNRKSRYGTCWILNGGVIAYESQKQTNSVDSTTEAELIAGCEAGKQSTFLHNILYTMVPGNYLPIQIRQDNQGAIALAENPQFHKRTKHIDNKHYYVRELVEDNRIRITYIPTKTMVADVLTKPLRAQDRKYALEAMGVGPV